LGRPFISDGLTRALIAARVLLDKSLVLGFCTAEGGATSHTAILARGLGLPAVVGVGPDVLEIPDGATLVLDGVHGTLLVEPDEGTVARYRARQPAATAVLARAREQAHEPAVTRDGHRVEVVANVGNAEGARAALEAGAEGVGLLRTEFLYLERTHLPDEEEQYRAYRAIVDAFGDRPVIMNPPAIPLAKQIIRALTLDEAREVAQAALELDSPEAVRALVRERVPAADVEYAACI